MPAARENRKSSAAQDRKILRILVYKKRRTWHLILSTSRRFTISRVVVGVQKLLALEDNKSVTVLSINTLMDHIHPGKQGCEARVWAWAFLTDHQRLTFEEGLRGRWRVRHILTRVECGRVLLSRNGTPQSQKAIQLIKSLYNGGKHDYGNFKLCGVVYRQHTDTTV